MKAQLLLFVCLVGFGVFGVCQAGGLRKNFYRDRCDSAEDIVRNITWKHVSGNPNLAAKLLRMHFHDCFVRGCDGSILINSTANSTAGKGCNSESKVCQVLIDSVSFQFKKPMWKVLTGRRDGRVSLASEVFPNIPSPFANFSQLKQNFSNKGLTVHDLVVLSGGHTIGIGHCNLFSFRLYNFTGKGDQDPSLNPAYAEFLKTKCRSLSDTTTTVEMDPGSSDDFDNNYFVILNQNKGLFQSDAALLTNKGARNIAKELTNRAKFFTEFAQSMKRMGAIEVLTGTAGEIRKQCSVIN
ncbi:Peroxidase [Melia azedarach]|uniref:Peroxidase n=1 Tax=Melia azedarach TaxID=155640 RepID=A0ACC1YYA5_MELAZ|nr:Peroxidase [Melia azedarach]